MNRDSSMGRGRVRLTCGVGESVVAMVVVLGAGVVRGDGVGGGFRKMVSAGPGFHGGIIRFCRQTQISINICGMLINRFDQ